MWPVASHRVRLVAFRISAAAGVQSGGVAARRKEKTRKKKGVATQNCSRSMLPRHRFLTVAEKKRARGVCSVPTNRNRRRLTRLQIRIWRRHASNAGSALPTVASRRTKQLKKKKKKQLKQIKTSEAHRAHRKNSPVRSLVYCGAASAPSPNDKKRRSFRRADQINSAHSN